MKWALIVLGLGAYLGFAVLVGMFCGAGNCDDSLWEATPDGTGPDGGH